MVVIHDKICTRITYCSKKYVQLLTAGQKKRGAAAPLDPNA